MKQILTICAFVFSMGISAMHHEEGEKHMDTQGDNFAYISTYTMAEGSNPARLQKSLLANIKTLEEDGYNRCGMLRHQFGGNREFLTYCYFDSWEQFADINDGVAATPDVKQLYGNHTDELVAVIESNAKVAPYVLQAKYSFGPYLTDNEKSANAAVLFDAYDRAFGGCNMTEHFWGPEQTWNFYCSYDSYADFATKVEALMVIHEEELADKKLDILEHSDNLYTRVSR